MRRPRRIQWPVIALALMVIAIVVAIPTVRYLTRPLPLLMQPEPPEAIARRNAPENAYYRLEEALRLLPFLPPPDPAKIQRFEAEQRPDSIGTAANLWLPDDDPDLRAYLEACDPVIQKVREALAAPYFLYPHIDEGGRQPIMPVREMAYLDSLLHARSLLALRMDNDAQAAWGFLLDGLRATRMRSTDGGSYAEFLACHQEAAMLDSVYELASHTPSIETLKNALIVLSDLASFSRPLSSYFEFDLRADHWHNWASVPWRRGTLALISQRFDQFQQIRLERRVRRFLCEHRDEFLAACDLPYDKFQEWHKSRMPLFKDGPISFEARPVSGRAYLKTWNAGARIVVSLELYRANHGTYPESLDALAPEYLDSVPTDAYFHNEFVYRPVDADYTLYGLGTRQRDDPREFPIHLAGRRTTRE